MIKEFLKYFLGYIKCKKHNIKCIGKCYIGGGKIINNGNFILGDSTIIRPSTDIYLHQVESTLKIGDNTEIGNHSTISSFANIIIGNGVLTGPHVFIADHNHKYSNPCIPIYKQGIEIKSNACLTIDDGTWIGTNTVIIGNVHIGKNCVIGANSVVTKDIPDCSIAVGCPARVIKKYNFDKQCWERI